MKNFIWRTLTSSLSRALLACLIVVTVCIPMIITAFVIPPVTDAGPTPSALASDPALQLDWFLSIGALTAAVTTLVSILKRIWPSITGWVTQVFAFIVSIIMVAIGSALRLGFFESFAVLTLWQVIVVDVLIVIIVAFSSNGLADTGLPGRIVSWCAMLLDMLPSVFMRSKARKAAKMARKAEKIKRKEERAAAKKAAKALKEEKTAAKKAPKALKSKKN